MPAAGSLSRVVAAPKARRSLGAVVVDYDTELDLLCQRVAAAGQSGLTIYRYPGEFPSHYAGQESALGPGRWFGRRGHA